MLNKDTCCRPTTHQANLVRDGPILQGPQAYLTTVARNIALANSYFFQGFIGDHKGYVPHVDYQQLMAAFKLRRVDGNTTDVIEPTPWPDAPKPDGSTVEFEAKLKSCQEYLHNFAMHTPEYFLTFNKQRQQTSSRRKQLSTRCKQPTSKKHRRGKGRGTNGDETTTTQDEDMDSRGVTGDEESECDDEMEVESGLRHNNGDEDEEDSGVEEPSVVKCRSKGGHDCDHHKVPSSTFIYFMLLCQVGQQLRKRKRVPSNGNEGRDQDMDENGDPRQDRGQFCSSCISCAVDQAGLISLHW